MVSEVFISLSKLHNYFLTFFHSIKVSKDRTQYFIVHFRQYYFINIYLHIIRVKDYISWKNGSIYVTVGDGRPNDTY